MPINHNKFAIIDFETGGLGRGCQPLSLGAVILDARRLTVADNGIFYSQICPSTTEECEFNGLDPVDPKALAVNKLDMNELLKAPKPKTVMELFINFMKYHNPKGDKWGAPIFTGWNAKYDYDIMTRMIYGHLPSKLTLHSKIIPKKDHRIHEDKDLAKAYKTLKFLKEPYGFGGETLFRPFPVVDVAQNAFMMFESIREPAKLSLDSVKAFLGFKGEGSHNALVDCLWTAEIHIRYLKLFRMVAPEVDYDTEGKTILNINSYLKPFNFNINNTQLVEEEIKVNELPSLSDEECPF